MGHGSGTGKEERQILIGVRKSKKVRNKRRRGCFGLFGPFGR